MMTTAFGDSDTLRFFDTIMDSWSILFCIVIIIILLAGVKVRKEKKILLLLMMVCHAFALASNLGGILFKGDVSDFGSMAVRVSNFGEFFFSQLMAGIFTFYIIDCVQYGTHRDLKVLRIITWIILLILEGFLVVSQFNGALYYIDTVSMYHRGEYFYISHLFVFILLIIDTVLVIMYTDDLRSRDAAAFSIYILLVTVAAIAQLLVYGIYWTLLATTMASIIMLVLLIIDQVEEYAQKESELAEMRQAIMLSQIQPHFLYNTLTSIAQLCEVDPKQAKITTIEFSDYLRENMNSLNKKEPVDFETELNHTKNYLAIEKTRFAELLNVEFDIRSTDFKVPVLSLQPIVENAVRHGLGMKENGGTIRISSEAYDDHYEVIVKDDGVGFKKDEVQNDHKKHIGIKNVQDRLKDMCNGTLEINSVINQGTEVIMKIPKKGEAK